MPLVSWTPLLGKQPHKMLLIPQIHSRSLIWVLLHYRYRVRGIRCCCLGGEWAKLSAYKTLLMSKSYWTDITPALVITIGLVLIFIVNMLNVKV